ncbi:MAG: site-2 protease family protein [Planctomycetes bacterium]|nr:site-2 protease family protein [Planctomycetota bacterium]
MPFRSLPIGRFTGADIVLHWSMWLLPVLVLIRGLYLYSTDEALLQFSLAFGVFSCVFIHELGQLLAANRLGLGIRSLTIYPIGGSAQLSEVSERPWKELRVSCIGPATHLIIAAAISFGLVFSDRSLSPHLDSPIPFLETFFNRLFWLNVMLATLHVIPAFPLDGGRIFRAALALSAGRLRSTEVAALLTSFIALLFLICGMIWMSHVWWLIAMGIVIHISGQQELMKARYFASLQRQLPDVSPRTPIMIPIEQLLDEESRPNESDFTGMIWNPRNHLWIVWRDGQPVSANALVGE